MTPASVRQIGVDNPGRLARDHRVVMEWLEQYVCRPHPDLGRTGPVCPFVRQALARGELQFSYRYEITGREVGRLMAVVREEIDNFLWTSIRTNHVSLRSRIVVLANVPADAAYVVDDCYPALKDVAVRRALMIGQFHPTCEEGAARNPAFAVSRSPLPLYVLRWMAPHDILFLHRLQPWFLAYRTTFSELHARRMRDSWMRQLFTAAEAEWGADERDEWRVE